MRRLAAVLALVPGAHAFAQSGWASLSASLQNNAREEAGSIVFDDSWPPPYVLLPPLYATDGPFTFTALVNVAQAGTVLALGDGPPGAPDLFGPHIAVWSDGSITWGASSTPACGSAPAGWHLVGASLNGTAYTVVRGNATCSGRLQAPLPAKWWMQGILGGAGFVGQIAQATIYDDAAFTAGQMLGQCGQRPQAPPSWTQQSGAVAWGSTSGVGCIDASRRKLGLCNALQVVTGPPGSSFFSTAGGADAFPFIALDLGSSQTVSSVQVFGTIDGYDANPSASYQLIVTDMRPPPAGTPQWKPLEIAPCAVLGPPSLPRGRAFDIECGSKGRYVILQLIDGGVTKGVLKIAYMGVNTGGQDKTAAPSFPRGSDPPDAPASLWNVEHRYGPAGMQDSYVVDSGGTLYGTSRGVTSGGGSLIFNGRQSCVMFSDWTASPTFSIIANFTSPPQASPFSSTVLWETTNARLHLRANGTAGVFTPTFSSGGVSVTGPAIPTSTAAALALVCDSGACSFVS